LIDVPGENLRRDADCLLAEEIQLRLLRVVPARQELLDLIEECAATALPPYAVLARKLGAALL
jgi:hypothetical protein